MEEIQEYVDFLNMNMDNEALYRGGLGSSDRKQGVISGKAPGVMFMPQPVSAVVC